MSLHCIALYTLHQPVALRLGEGLQGDLVVGLPDNLGAPEPLTSALLLRGQGERQLVRENDLPRAAALAAGLQPEENFGTIFLG